MADEPMHEIELDDETMALLQKVAAATGMTPDDVMTQALTDWVAQDGEPTT